MRRWLASGRQSDHRRHGRSIAGCHGVTDDCTKYSADYSTSDLHSEQQLPQPLQQPQQPHHEPQPSNGRHNRRQEHQQHRHSETPQTHLPGELQQQQHHPAHHRQREPQQQSEHQQGQEQRPEQEQQQLVQLLGLAVEGRIAVSHAAEAKFLGMGQLLVDSLPPLLSRFSAAAGGLFSLALVISPGVSLVLIGRDGVLADGRGRFGKCEGFGLLKAVANELLRGPPLDWCSLAVVAGVEAARAQGLQASARPREAAFWKVLARLQRTFQDVAAQTEGEADPMVELEVYPDAPGKYLVNPPDGGGAGQDIPEAQTKFRSAGLSREERRARARKRMEEELASIKAAAASSKEAKADGGANGGATGGRGALVGMSSGGEDGGGGNGEAVGATAGGAPCDAEGGVDGIARDSVAGGAGAASAGDSAASEEDGWVSKRRNFKPVSAVVAGEVKGRRPATAVKTDKALSLMLVKDAERSLIGVGEADSPFRGSLRPIGGSGSGSGNHPKSASPNPWGKLGRALRLALDSARVSPDEGDAWAREALRRQATGSWEGRSGWVEMVRGDEEGGGEDGKRAEGWGGEGVSAHVELAEKLEDTKIWRSGRKDVMVMGRAKSRSRPGGSLGHVKEVVRQPGDVVARLARVLDEGGGEEDAQVETEEEVVDRLRSASLETLVRQRPHPPPLAVDGACVSGKEELSGPLQRSAHPPLFSTSRPSELNSKSPKSSFMPGASKPQAAPLKKRWPFFGVRGKKSEVPLGSD